MSAPPDYVMILRNFSFPEAARVCGGSFPELRLSRKIPFPISARLLTQVLLNVILPVVYRLCGVCRSFDLSAQNRGLERLAGITPAPEK